MRRSEDSGTLWSWAEVALCGALVLVWFCLNKIDRGEWWRGLPAFPTKLTEGIGLVGFGFAFLWMKWKARQFKPSCPWEFRNLLVDIAFVIGGVACLIEAMQAR